MAKASQADLAESIVRRQEQNKRKQKVSSNGHVPGLLLPSHAVELPMNLSAYFNENGFCLLQGDCREILAQFPDDHFDMVFADLTSCQLFSIFGLSASKKRCG